LKHCVLERAPHIARLKGTSQPTLRKLRSYTNTADDTYMKVTIGKARWSNTLVAGGVRITWTAEEEEKNYGQQKVVLARG